jgi:hypothetical protein
MRINSRCELLSKVDIFDIRNNFYVYNKTIKLVVNCSQKLISLIFGTTGYVYPDMCQSFIVVFTIKK